MEYTGYWLLVHGTKILENSSLLRSVMRYSEAVQQNRTAPVGRDHRRMKMKTIRSECPAVSITSETFPMAFAAMDAAVKAAGFWAYPGPEWQEAFLADFAASTGDKALSSALAESGAS